MRHDGQGPHLGHGCAQRHGQLQPAGRRTDDVCRQGCRQSVLAPEQDVRRLRRRVGNVPGGVPALAVLRAAAFFALAAGIRFWSFLYNSLGIPIAAMGWLNPMIAGAAMAMSSLSVIVNPSLLRGYRRATS